MQFYCATLTLNFVANGIRRAARSLCDTIGKSAVEETNLKENTFCAIQMFAFDMLL